MALTRPIARQADVSYRRIWSLKDPEVQQQVAEQIALRTARWPMAERRAIMGCGGVYEL